MAVTRTGWLVITVIVVLFAIPLAVVAANPSISPLTTGIRIAGLTGFVALAGAMIMTPFLPEIYRNFGRPFLRIHHLFAVAGIILVTLHPVFFAIRLMSVAVFLPSFGSLYEFFALGGRLALILMYAALAGVFLRAAIPAWWRGLHALMWVVLALALLHGMLIGTDLREPIIGALFTTLTIAALGAFFAKRIQRRRIAV
jgi:predicted ferric reductase